MKCTNCGHEINPGDRFCGECGTPVAHVPPAQDAQQSINQHMNQNPNTAPLINKEQVNAQSRELLNEGKSFFSQAFKNQDGAIKENNGVSILLSSLLIVLGLILIALLISIKIPAEIAYLGVSKSSLILKLILTLIVYLAVVIGAAFALSKLMINRGLTFRKLLSDYVMINVIPFLVILAGVLMVTIDVYKLGVWLIILGTLLLSFTALYLFGKYSEISHPRISSIFTVIIYTIIIMIAATLFISSIIDWAESFSTSFMNNIFDGY